MEKTWNRMRNLIKHEPHSAQVVAEPQLGFRVSFGNETKQLRVKVIGARQLPASYGTTKPVGYLVKVVVFPGREKYETQIQKDTWPTFNEEFTFHLLSNKKSFDPFQGKFISFTVYSVLDPAASAAPEFETRLKEGASSLKRFFSLKEAPADEPSVELRRNKFRSSFRHSFSNRRVVGAVTYKLLTEVFKSTRLDEVVSTADVWREISPITSGMLTESREGQKGSIEVTLTYSISENRNNDVVEIAVTKFRCNLKTMQEHEKHTGSLYIKITAFEEEDVIQKMKSDTFQPTIALKIEHSTLRAKVRYDDKIRLKVWIRLISKNVLGQKTVLGKVEIDGESEIWNVIAATPSQSLTRMMSFT